MSEVFLGYSGRCSGVVFRFWFFVEFKSGKETVEIELTGQKLRSATTKQDASWQLDKNRDRLTPD